jgi:hypothetical protein
VAAGILFLPASWAAALGLTQIRSSYPAVLGVAVLLAVAVLIIEGTMFAWGWLRDRERSEPYERYQTDEFFGLRWRWSWYGGRVAGPRAFCPSCDLQLDGRLQATGIMDMPTGEIQYYCPCGATNIVLRAPNPSQLAHEAGLCAEREARKRGLLRN